MFGRLGDDVAAGVEPGPARPAGELLELADAEPAHLASVELRQAGEQDGADGDVDAHPERVGAGDDEEDALQGEAFDEAAVLREHARVVDADAVEEEPAQGLTEALGEREPLDRLGDAGLLILRREVDGEEAGGEVDGTRLGVGDDVDGGLVVADEARRVSESGSVEYSKSSGTGRDAEVTTAESRPVASSMVRRISVVSPRVADMRTNCVCGISRRGTCQAQPRVGSAK